MVQNLELKMAVTFDAGIMVNNHKEFFSNSLVIIIQIKNKKNIKDALLIRSLDMLSSCIKKSCLTFTVNLGFEPRLQAGFTWTMQLEIFIRENKVYTKQLFGISCL